MAITPDERLVFATMTGYGYITSWRHDGNVLSIAKDPACPKVPGDGTIRGIGGIVGSGPNDIWLTPEGAYLYQIYGEHLETGGPRRPTGWFARRGHQREHSVQQPPDSDSATAAENDPSRDRGSADGRKRVGTALVAAGGAGGEPAANENREEQSNMTNETVIMLIEARIQPQRRTELVEAARQYLPLVRAEPGVQAFYITARKDDPNAFVFYEIYRSQAAQDFHLQQDFTQKFLATLKSAQFGDRVRTDLVELAPEEQTYPN